MFVIFSRTLLMYLAIIISVRIMGKRQIGQMQASELVVTILISEVAAIPLQDLSQPLVNGLISIFTLVVLEVAVSALCLVSTGLRKALSGKSTIVIDNGRLDQKALRKLRMTVDDLHEALRLKDVFSISDVQYAVIETNGQMSVLLFPEHRPAEAGPLDVCEEDLGYPAVVISDGRITDEGLKRSGLNRGGVDMILEKKGLKLDDVFIMTVDQKSNVSIIRKEPNK